MKKFLITSQKYTGPAEVYYNSKGILCAINCKDTNMEPDIIRAFKKAVPVLLTELINGTAFTADTKIVEAGYRISFEEFWRRYNKKLNKYRCIPLYDKLTDAETIECLEGIRAYDAFLSRVQVRQKLDPENWIKQKAWENDWKNA